MAAGRVIHANRNSPRENVRHDGVGTLVRWIKQAGEKVAAGEVIAEVETDKATVELEAPADGVLHRILIQEGTEDIPVGALLAVIASEGTRE